MKNKCILFLGVNNLQIPALKNAADLGLIIIGIDCNKNAPGKRYCDYFFNINCLNIQEIYNNINFLDIELVGIWANNDILIPSRVVLSHLFGLRDISIKNSFELLNKKIFKKKIDNKSYSIPWMIIKKDYLDIDKMKFPLIAKPMTGGGSKGIKIINNFNELIKYKFDKPVIFEEFKKGYEIGINMFKNNNQIYRLGAVYRYFKHDNHSTPLGTITMDNKKQSINY